MPAGDANTRASDARETILAFSAWLALSVLAIAFVGRYATPLAFLDDLILIDRLQPHATIDLDWLWGQHNEHRIPLPKLLWFVLLSATRDLRAGAYFDVVLLALLALWTMAVARRLRGRTSLADLLFPLVFLTWGNTENLLNSFQVCLIVPVFLLSAVVLVLVRGARSGTYALTPADLPPAALTRAASVSIGACLLLLPLCGIVGITFAVPLLVWFALVACSAWRSRTRGARAAASVAFVISAATVALIAATFIDYSFLPGFEHAGPLRTLEATAQVASQSSGWVAQDWWPYSALLIVALLLATMFVLGRAAVRAAREHALGEFARASGLLACLLSLLALALSIAWGRGNDGWTAGFCNRYGTFGAPLYVIAAFSAAQYLRPALERRVRWSLFAAWLALWFANVPFAVDYGTTRQLHAAALIEDARAGIALPELAARHWRGFSYSEELFTGQLELLQQAHLAPFEQP